MAANTIGSLTFDVMHGSPHEPAPTVEPLVRRGRDYARWRKAGYRAHPAQIRTVKYYASAATAAAGEIAYAAIRGTAVTVIDPHNTSYLNCMVADVQVTSKRACIQAGAAKIRMVAEWAIVMGDDTAT